jgi:tRNA-dihydrouridine synthase
MAGVSDAALRLLCKEMGAGLVATELTSKVNRSENSSSFHKKNGRLRFSCLALIWRRYKKQQK